MERLNLLRTQLNSSKLANNNNTLSITDNRTGKVTLTKVNHTLSHLLMASSKHLTSNQ